MENPRTLLDRVAELLNEVERATRLAFGLNAADSARLTRFADDLREQAAELERQAAAETPSRPPEPKRDESRNDEKPPKGRGGSNDPESQA